jgi:hypothetical protein
MHRELADDRLSGAGGRTDQHAVTVLQGTATAELEIVELEGHLGGEPGQLRVLPAQLGGRIGLGWGERRASGHCVRVPHVPDIPHAMAPSRGRVTMTLLTPR